MDNEIPNYDRLLTTKLGEIGLSHRYELGKNGCRHLIVEKTKKPWWNFLGKSERLVAIVKSEPAIPPIQRSFKDLRYADLEIDVLTLEFYGLLDNIAQDVGITYGRKSSVTFRSR